MNLKDANKKCRGRKEEKSVQFAVIVNMKW